MTAMNASGWRPSMGDTSNVGGPPATSSGDRALMLEEPLSFEIGDASKCGVDLDEIAAKPLAGLGKFLRKAAPAQRSQFL